MILKNHLIRIFFLVLTISVGTSTSRAELISSVDANLGITSLNLKTQLGDKTLSSTSALEINYVLKHVAASTAYIVSFAEMLSSADGTQLPYTLFSFGIRYYTSGFNGSRLILDRGAVAKVWKATPFIGFNMGVANISTEQYNASVIDMSPRLGVEMPITASLLGQAQLVIKSGSATGISAQTSISYTGISAYLGIILTSF